MVHMNEGLGWVRTAYITSENDEVEVLCLFLLTPGTWKKLGRIVLCQGCSYRHFPSCAATKLPCCTRTTQANLGLLLEGNACNIVYYVMHMSVPRLNGPPFPAGGHGNDIPYVCSRPCKK